MDDGDGQLNNKFVIFDDMLAFNGCKMKVWPCNTLINVVKSFHKACNIGKSQE